MFFHHLLSLPPSLFPDNELPDYTMVMLVNNNTLLQVNSDLRLFLWDNMDRLATSLSVCRSVCLSSEE